MVESKEKHLVVRVRPSIKKQLEDLAEERGIRPSDIVRQALDHFFSAGNPATTKDFEDLKAQFIDFKEALKEAAAIENIKAFSRGVFLGWYGHLFPECPSSIDAWINMIAEKTGKTGAQVWEDMERFEKANIELWKKRVK